MKKVVITNYGIGNILSVKRSFEHCGANVLVSSSKDDIKSADRIVVPGVGAFNNCMYALDNNNLKGAILEFAETNRPYLGICVGMQMMLEKSEEFGIHDGLGLMKGNVTKIGENISSNTKHKVPFVGWKSLEVIQDIPLFKGISPEDRFYFVHSYRANPENTENLLACYKYDNSNIAAVIGKNNIYGTQFHPEKSGNTGLSIIKNFLEL